MVKQTNHNSHALMNVFHFNGNELEPWQKFEDFIGDNFVSIFTLNNYYLGICLNCLNVKCFFQIVWYPNGAVHQILSKKLNANQTADDSKVLHYPHTITMDPTSAGKPGKMGVHIPVREKSGNLNILEKLANFYLYFFLWFLKMNCIFKYIFIFV